MVVREPITVVLSDKGWVRALRGHVEDLSGIAFKQDDKLKLVVLRRDDVEVPAVRHQRPLLHDRGRQAAGRARTWRAGAAVRRPGAGGGHRHRCSRSRADGSSSSASHQGRGFIVAEDECLGTTRKGKQVLNVKAPDEARAVARGRGRAGRGHRREPQDGDLPARAVARDGARRAACGCSATRTAGCPT